MLANSSKFQEDIKKALHVPLDRSQWVQEALHNATSSNSIGPLPECFQDWAAIEQEIASRDCEARISQPFLRAPLQYPPYDLLNYRHNASFLELHPETSGPWIFVDVSEKIDWSLLIGPVRKRSGLRLERVQLIGKQYNISGNKNSELKEDTVPFNVQYEDSRTLTRTKVAKVSDAKVPNLEGIRKVLMEEGECFGSAHMVVRKLQQLFDEPTAEKAQTAVNWHYQQLAGQKLDRQNINHPLRGQVPLLDMQLGVCLLD